MLNCSLYEGGGKKHFCIMLLECIIPRSKHAQFYGKTHALHFMLENVRLKYVFAFGSHKEESSYLTAFIIGQETITQSLIFFYGIFREGGGKQIYILVFCN